MACLARPAGDPAPASAADVRASQPQPREQPADRHPPRRLRPAVPAPAQRGRGSERCPASHCAGEAGRRGVVPGARAAGRLAVPHRGRLGAAAADGLAGAPARCVVPAASHTFGEAAPDLGRRCSAAPKSLWSGDVSTPPGGPGDGGGKGEPWRPPEISPQRQILYNKMMREL